MHGEKFSDPAEKYTSIDYEQLLQQGKSLHNQAVCDALIGMIDTLRAVLRKDSESSLGAHRLKHN